MAFRFDRLHQVIHRAHRAVAPLRRQAVVSGDISVPAAYWLKEALDFYLQPVGAGLCENEIALRSTRAARTYETGDWISRVSHTSLLLVIALEYKMTPT